MSNCYLSEYLCTPLVCTHLVLIEARRGQPTPWTWLPSWSIYGESYFSYIAYVLVKLLLTLWHHVYLIFTWIFSMHVNFPCRGYASRFPMISGLCYLVLSIYKGNVTININLKKCNDIHYIEDKDMKKTGQKQI